MLRRVQAALIDAADKALNPVPLSLTRYLPALYARLVDLNYRYRFWKTRHSVGGVSFYTRHLLDVVYYEYGSEGDKVGDLLLERILEESEEEDVLYDIGANSGLYSIFFLCKITGSQAVAFEPNPKVFRQLSANIELNDFEERFKGYELALYDESTTRDLYIAEHPFHFFGDSRFSTLVEHNSQGQQKRLKGKIECSTEKLDTLVLRDDLPPPSHIKIDVQGTGLQVLEGALETIKEHKPTIYYELHDDETGEIPHSKLESISDKLDYEIEELNEFYIIMRPRNN